MGAMAWYVIGTGHDRSRQPSRQSRSSTHAILSTSAVSRTTAPTRSPSIPAALSGGATTSVGMPIATDIVAGRAARERGIYNVEEILRCMEKDHRVEHVDALKLFHVAQFELWHRIHRGQGAAPLPRSRPLSVTTATTPLASAPPDGM